VSAARKYQPELFESSSKESHQSQIVKGSPVNKRGDLEPTTKTTAARGDSNAVSMTENHNVDIEHVPTLQDQANAQPRLSTDNASTAVQEVDIAVPSAMGSHARSASPLKFSRKGGTASTLVCSRTCFCDELIVFFLSFLLSFFMLFIHLFI
jgi:hypothetical protein